MTLRNAGGLFEGHSRLGATGPYYIMDAIGRFSQAYPAIALTCRIGHSEKMLRDLSRLRNCVGTRWNSMWCLGPDKDPYWHYLKVSFS